MKKSNDVLGIDVAAGCSEDANKKKNPKKYLKFPGCRYSLGPAASRGEQHSRHPAFPDRSCCFWIAAGSEAPSRNPRIFCQLCLFRTAATAEAGSKSHTFICFPSWKTCDKTASGCAGGIKKRHCQRRSFQFASSGGMKFHLPPSFRHIYCWIFHFSPLLPQPLF